MKDRKALEIIKEHYERNCNTKKLEIEIVSEETLQKIVSVCDDNKHMEISIYLYDDEKDEEFNSWIETEGEGYGWLWLQEADDEDKWHGLLQEKMMEYVKNRKDRLSERCEYVLTGEAGNNTFFHFIEREDNLRDTLFLFSDSSLDCFS